MFEINQRIEINADVHARMCNIEGAYTRSTSHYHMQISPHRSRSVNTAPMFYQELECIHLSILTGNKHRGFTILHCVREDVRAVSTKQTK